MPTKWKRTAAYKRATRHILMMPCTICGGTAYMCVDHIWPKSLGGSDELFNLQPLCNICNTRKGNRFTNVELRQWHAEDPEWHVLMDAYWNQFKKPPEERGVYINIPRRRRSSNA